MKAKKIRSVTGPQGMMIYTPDGKQACIADKITGTSYTLRTEPSYFWYDQEELFNITYLDHFTKKQTIALIVRLSVEMIAALCIPMVLKSMLTNRQSTALYLLLISISYILEFSIFRGMRRSRTIKGRNTYAMRGALNKALNAYEKKGRATVEYAKKCSIYRQNATFLEPHEASAVILLFVSISFLMPNFTIQLVLIPLWIGLIVLGCKTSLFGLLRVTSVVQPSEYELKIACELVEFWHTISYSKAPENAR